MEAKKYWGKWAAILIFKSIFELLFISFGLGVPILEWLGMINIPYTGEATHLMFVRLVSGILSLFAIVDWVATLVAPWKGGTKDWPAFMEYWPPWQEYKDET